MKIQRIPTPDMQRWPVNSTRHLLPVVALRGFPGHGSVNLIVAFWKWRADFVLW